MKRLVLSFEQLYENDRLKCLKQEILQIYLHLFDFMYNVLKFFKVLMFYRLEVVLKVNHR